MDKFSPTRRNVLRAGALAGLTAGISGLPRLGAAADQGTPGPLPGSSEGPLDPPRGPGQVPVDELTTTPRERVRVGVIGCGGRGQSMTREVLNVPFADVLAVADLRKDHAEAAARSVAAARGATPAAYSGDELAWKPLCERDDLDFIYIATPWEWHVPMALHALECGKHAGVEVPAATTLADCWRLVDTSERTKRHCVMMENCCYGESELLLLNMVQHGVFGDIVHGEAGYLHDLRGVLYSLGGEGDWRRHWHTLLDGNLYPTHGLGPIAHCMNIGRGDSFRYLVSMSSPERSLSSYRASRKPNGGQHAAEVYKCGDMNTSLIKTTNGNTIMLQHDTVSPRPYSRINTLYGTAGTFCDYPMRLALDDPHRYGLKADGPDGWMDDADLNHIKETMVHPLWAQLRERAAGGGHGGMDFVMFYRLLDRIRQGKTPDSVVYDAAAWSAPMELSIRSVASGSMPMPFPDFTRGRWAKTGTPLLEV